PRASKAAVVAGGRDRRKDPDPRTLLMVCDRPQDFLGARAHGVACLGAGWGYGNPGELAAAGALAICATPDDLADALGVRADAATS
ncbi:MAG: HAD hydrolase-like protein, partial [Jatrophihabitantaceae bacterium]